MKNRERQSCTLGSVRGEVRVVYRTSSTRHRKNALFYKTENGAGAGDVFMTLVHTAELSGMNPFDYLTELLRHPREVADNADACRVSLGGYPPRLPTDPSTPN